jgi:hypothetical protein
MWSVDYLLSVIIGQILPWFNNQYLALRFQLINYIENKSNTKPDENKELCMSLGTYIWKLARETKKIV